MNILQTGRDVRSEYALEVLPGWMIARQCRVNHAIKYVYGISILRFSPREIKLFLYPSSLRVVNRRPPLVHEYLAICNTP